MIVESTKKFAQEYLKPRVINDYKKIVDKTIFKEFGNIGLLGLQLMDIIVLEKLI